MPGKQEDIDVLVSSVNVQRLSNFPATLTEVQIRGIYERIITI